MKTQWANPQKIGVILYAGSIPRYIDSGSEYQAAIDAIPEEWQPLSFDANTPDPLTLERSTMIVSRFQARAALHMAGMLTTVDAFIKTADFITQLAWTDAQEFRRNSPTIAALAGGLGLDDTELDDLFRAAKQIEA